MRISACNGVTVPGVISVRGDIMKGLENAIRNRWAFLWGEYGSKDFRSPERRHRKTGTELHHSAESQT